MTNGTPRSLSLAAVLVLSLGLLTNVSAQTVTYTFEQFGVGGQATPLINVSPDSGTASFNASFTSAPNPGAFVVIPFAANALFSGNSLTQSLGQAGNVLTVTLNMAVNSVSLVFGTNGTGTLTFACAAGTVSVASTPQGGFFLGGTLAFSSATPFNAFTLTTGSAPEFAIDNLTMRIAAPVGVPDGGSTLALAGVAALLILSAHRHALRAQPARRG